MDWVGVCRQRHQIPIKVSAVWHVKPLCRRFTGGNNCIRRGLCSFQPGFLSSQLIHPQWHCTRWLQKHLRDWKDTFKDNSKSALMHAVVFISMIDNYWYRCWSNTELNPVVQHCLHFMWPRQDTSANIGSLLFTWINFNPSMGKYLIHDQVWDEITRSFPNFNGSLGMDK